MRVTNEWFNAPLSPHGRPGSPVPGQDRSDVRHLCPECGGQSTADLGNLLVVQLCRHCGGTGLMTDEQLSAYLRFLNDPHNPQGA